MEHTQIVVPGPVAQSPARAQPVVRVCTQGYVKNLERVLLLLLFCIGAVHQPDAHAAEDYRTIEWVDLIPAQDLDALLNPPDALFEIEENSALDQMPADGTLSQSLGNSEAARRYEAALQSTAVNPGFDGERVRIPGFVVPLAFDETRMISEFFLVPYFGACLHMPPPPPNQIIHSKFGGGLTLDDIYEPFWLEGTLSVGLEQNMLGTSAYRLEVDRVAPYEEG